jgi:hypothetical protein
MLLIDRRPHPGHVYESKPALGAAVHRPDRLGRLVVVSVIVPHWHRCASALSAPWFLIGAGTAMASGSIVMVTGIVGAA